MILDSSAIIAVFFQESGFEKLMETMGQSQYLGVGAPTLTESAIVISARLKGDSRLLLGQFLIEVQVDVIPFGQDHYQMAVNAYLKYGKGQHRAALNFGDCMSYAVAKVSKHPLLYLGNDFSLTDINEG